MKLKLIFITLLGSGLFLFSCQNTPKSENKTATESISLDQPIEDQTDLLVGSWEDQSDKKLNFTLFADGRAQSDNMATLLIQHWSVKQNELSLVIQSIGNKQTFSDTVVYTIQTLNVNDLILKQGDITLTYKKINDKVEQKILKGELVLGHEANTFKPCGSDKTFWITDKTGKLKDLYTKLTTDKKAYTPVFAELELKNKGKASEGFPANYESVYEVLNVLQVKSATENDCKQ